MAFYERFVSRSRDNFYTLEDLMKNYRVIADDTFNYGYDVLDELAKELPDSLAMLWVGADNSERRFTFKDLKRLSDKSANVFKSCGVKKGDMVMLVLKRGYQFWYAMQGLHKVGAIAIPATNQLMPKDFVYRCNAAGVKMVVLTGDDDVTEHFLAAKPECSTVKVMAVTKGKRPSGDWLDFDAAVEAASENWEKPTGDDYAGGEDPMLAFFTSGTTGYPKLVWHSCKYPLGHVLTGCFWHRVEPGGLHFTISDTGWGKALWGKMYSQWMGESAVFVYDFERFHAADILEKMAKYRVTTFCAPPTMYRYLIQEDIKKYDLSALHHCTTAGEALNPEVYNKWQKATGLKIFEGFGQTETTLCCLTVYPFMQPRLGSMGLPAPGYRLIVADADGNECEPGVTGEICIRTDEAGGGKPCGLFLGYYKDEELTKKVWHDDLYHTGDTAYRDEMGFLWYVGRTDDVIKSSGYRIGPFEVESSLMEHPAVLEVAVTGIPDPVRGQLVKATIVLTAGYQPSPELVKELQNYVKKNTAPYKYPRVIEFVDSLPKSISGKIRRVEIRERDKKMLEGAK